MPTYPPRAHALVAKAIREGSLPKLDGSVKCADCGGIATDYDHRDYDKPLEVVAVCKSCNCKRGRGKNSKVYLNPRVRTATIALRLPPTIKRRMEKRATKMMMTPSAFIRWCIEQVLDSMEWDDQMKRDVKSGKMKKLYEKEA